MKNISWSQLNIILAIIVTTVLLLGTAGGILYHSPGKRVTIADVELMNDAWIVQTDAEYDSATDLPCNLEAAKGETVSISHYLPEDLGQDCGLAFRSVYNAVQVKIGDRIIYQYGIDEQRPFTGSPVPNWNFIPLDSTCAGQLLTITQISYYGKYAGFFPSIQFGSRSALLYQQWRQNGWGLLLSIVLLLLAGGLTLVLIMAGMSRKVELCVWYYLIFAGITALWSISGSPLLSIYINNGFLSWLFHILTRMTIPVAWLLYIRCFANKRRLILAIDIGLLVSCVCYVVVVILQMLGLLEFAVTYDILGILYGVGFLIYTAGTLAGWIGYGIQELRTIGISNTLFCIAGIVNLFLRPDPLYQTEGTFWQISVMLYLFLTLGATVEAVIRQMNRRVEQAEAEYAGQRQIAIRMMNPNFLFATLNTLLAMTKAKSGNAAKLVFAFSQYLRYNLDSVREERLVSFEEELKHIAVYLEIQQLRMPELRVTIENKIHDFFVPVRSVEAIVENAVKYGIGKHENQGQVTIRSYERRDSYAIQIVDDGAGFDTDLLYRKQTPTSMKTNMERLSKIGAVLEVNSRLQKGTIVTVKIPKSVINEQKQKEHVGPDGKDSKV